MHTAIAAMVIGERPPKLIVWAIIVLQRHFTRFCLTREPAMHYGRQHIEEPLMPQVLAICDVCGEPFSSGINIAAGVAHTTLIGNKAGPCPRCGSSGTIPDGVYDTVDGVISRVALSGASIGEIRDLHRLLGDWSSRSADSIADDIDEISPRFNPLTDFLRSSALKQLVIGVLIIVLAGLILDTVREPSNTTINEVHFHLDADAVIRRIAESAQRTEDE